MGVWDSLEKIGKTAAKGTLWYLEEASKNAAKNKNYTQEQRQSLLNYSDKMNGYRSRITTSSINDHEDDYNDTYSSAVYSNGTKSLEELAKDITDAGLLKLWELYGDSESKEIQEFFRKEKKKRGLR